MLKKIIITLLGLFIFLTSPISAQASEVQSEVQIPNEIQLSLIDIKPTWVNILEFRNDFNILSGGKATVDVRVYAYSASQVKIQAYLQQYVNGNWTTIKTWELTSNSNSCNLGDYYYVNNGYSYRLISIGTVYQNGVQVEQAGKVSDTIYF